MKAAFFDKDRKVYLSLFLLSFSFYFFYFHHLFLHLNSCLFHLDGDSLKNYYTYMYHIERDANLFHFSGMNYPFGEHIVYTDCQPLLTFILRALPFAQPYAIGIMHFLILFSFIITPLILYRIFRIFQVDHFLAFCSSLAIVLISPQTRRISGHFGMAYDCVIPLAILLLLLFFREQSLGNSLKLFFYNLGLFLIHPYIGLGSSGFCFLSIVLTGFLSSGKHSAWKTLAKAALTGLAPMLVFNLFLLLTDTHSGRTPEPYGVDIMEAAASLESVFTPSFGPFDLFLKNYIHSEHVDGEALSYIGIFPLFLMLIALLALPFYFRRLRVSKELAGLFIAAVLLLLFSFGLHVQVLRSLHINITALNQFRCLGRYAWFFYFLLPVFLITGLSHLSLPSVGPRIRQAGLAVVGLLFLSFNLLEAHHLMLFMLKKGSFQSKNIFDPKQLSSSEKSIIRDIRSKNFQAIVPLPLFHIGSDVYQKNGEESFLPAVLYSYHAALPILGEVLSRTSIQETEMAIELLNRYKRDRPINSLLNQQPFLVIKTGDAQKEDELRVLKTLSPFTTEGNRTFYSATKEHFTASEAEKNKFLLISRSDSAKNILFIPFEHRRPFIPAPINSYEKIVTLDSNRLASGDYNVSFRYQLPEKKFRFIYNHLIVVKTAKDYEHWEYFTAVRSASGIYDSFIIFEQKIKIDQHFGYQFILNGSSVESYRISDFLLRPAALDIKMIRSGETLYNNFPE